MRVKKSEAIKLFQSTRGHYIIGQALYIAIKEMKKVPSPYTEFSNIVDMELLMNEIFPIYKSAAAVSKSIVVK